jgi:hypothetical protein
VQEELRLKLRGATSTSCSQCYKIDTNACATNIAEMNAMKKEIARLSNSLIDEKKEEPKKRRV